MWIFFSLLLSSALALKTQEPPAPTRLARNEPEERWLNVRLNQFKAFNNETFPMRFYYNKLTSSDENIVIFVGAEWEITPGFVTGGLGYYIANETGASLFYTEHRYYGQTKPTQDTSTTELRYLTIDQSLADLAQFIQHVKSDDFEYGQYKHGKVVLVGCSLAGTMATWMRLGYPHLVDIVVADSGPLHAQEDFPEYLGVVFSEIQRQGSSSCYNAINQAIMEINNAFDTNTGLPQLSTMFNTCSTLSASSALDYSTFLWFGITESFAGLVQSARPQDIMNACGVLTDPTVPSAMQRLANWINQYRPDTCLETRYNEVVNAFTNTSYDAPDREMRLWTYQTCVEFGWYQTTGDYAPASLINRIPVDYFHQMCRDFFSVDFTPEFLRAGISRTNLLFAGLTHMPDYVVSVQSTADPWSPMGPNHIHATAKSPVYVLEGASHCNVIGSTQENELEEVTRTREEIVEYVANVVHADWPSGAMSLAGSVTTALLMIVALSLMS